MARTRAGVPPKSVQERLGQRSIAVKMDTHSHGIPAMDAEAAVTIANLIKTGRPSRRGTKQSCRQRRLPGMDGEDGNRSLQVRTGADARNRTGDPIITSDVLCQLSYVGPRVNAARL